VTEFKVGDRVRFYEHGSPMNGRIGLITHIDEKPDMAEFIRVVFDGAEPRVVRDWICTNSNLSLVPESKAGAPSPLPTAEWLKTTKAPAVRQVNPFEVGDRVRQKSDARGSQGQFATVTHIATSWISVKYDDGSQSKSFYFDHFRFPDGSFDRALSSSQAGGTGEADPIEQERAAEQARKAAEQAARDAKADELDRAVERLSKLGPKDPEPSPSATEAFQAAYEGRAPVDADPLWVRLAIRRARHIATARAELDRGQHPRAWPEAAYEDAPDGEL